MIARNAVAAKPAKPKKCRCGCGALFSPRLPLQIAATVECALRIARKKSEKDAAEKAKQERTAFRARKEKAKRTSDLKREAQSAINAYRRQSDIKAGYGCICCGEPFEPDRPGGAVDAGHYLSRGSHPNLAFVEMNINAQRKSCNRPGGTTAAKFRRGMIERYGLEAVEALESDTTPRRYRAEDYRRIRDEYRAKLKALNAGGKRSDD